MCDRYASASRRSPRQNFVEVVTLRSGNLALAPCEQSENLPLMLGALFLPARGDV